MYDERKERFSIKDVIIQVLFVALFVFLLLWLFPMKNDIKKSFKPLYDQIFNQNVETMKEAAITYYTTPRLPQKIGEEKKMTLAEMLEANLVLPFADSKGEQCDLNESYVSITKMNDEYILKVNLKCSNQEDYLLVHLGCYDYCDGDVCEKQEEPKEETPVVNPTPTPKPTPVPTPQPKPTCNDNYNKTFNVNFYVNGALNKSVNVKLGGTVDLSKLVKEGYTFDGWYKDSSLKTKAISINPVATYDANNCITGYKDINLYGKLTKNPTPVVTTKYLYEYVKVTDGKWGDYSDWSQWTTNVITETDYRAVETKTETETTYKTEEVTTQKPIYGTKTVQTGTKKEAYTDTVQVTKYRTVPVYETQKVLVGTKDKYVDKVVEYKVPIYKTVTKYEERTVTKYRTVQKFVKMEYTLDCTNTCKRVEKPVYETVQEPYTVTEKVAVGTEKIIVGYETKTKTVKVYAGQERIYETKTVQVGTKQEAYTDTVQVTKYREIPVYETITVQVGTEPVTTTVKTPITKTVTYYRSKTREYISGTIDTKWSSSQTDTKLLSQGYSLTGNKKEVK